MAHELHEFGRSYTDSTGISTKQGWPISIVAMRNWINFEMEEVSGLLELGLEKECLHLSKAVLRREPLDAYQFVSCLDAVLICADRLHPWKHRIEAAFARLSAAVKGKARNKLFHFYASLPDWESAFEHRPRNPTTASDLLFSMWTFLELREMKLAKALVPKCKKALEVCQDEQDGSSLIEAVACYFAQAADWDKAVEMWEYGERAMPFAPNAWEGILKINALKAFLKANEVFQFVREDEPWEKLDVAFMARSGGSARLKADKLFHRYAKHLAKVVPAKERWRFGV